MKIRFCTLLILLAVPCLGFAQLLLESVSGKKQVSIGLDKEIGLKMPTFTTNNDYNCCYELIRGYLKMANSDSVQLVLKKIERSFTDYDGVFKRHTIDFQWESTAPTPVPIGNLQAVFVYSKGKSALDNLGGAMMLVAGFQALVINPLMEGKKRKTADKIVGSVFAIGFTMAVLPNKRTYYLEQPSGEPKPLWRLKK